MKLRLPRLLQIAIMATFSTTALFAVERHEGPLSGDVSITFGDDTLIISTGEAGSSTTFSGNLEGKGAITIGGGDQMGGTLIFTGKYLPSEEYIGDFTISNATLDLRGGGQLFASKFTRSHLTLNTGGTLILEDWEYGETTKNLGGLGHNDGYVVLNGGTIRMANDVDWSEGCHSGGSRSVLLGEGANTLSVDEGKMWVVAGKIYQNADGRTLNKAGTGRLVLGRSVDYNGLTTISEGTLSLVVGKKWESGALVDDGMYGELKGDVLLSGTDCTLEGSGTGTAGNIVGGAVTMQGANGTLSGNLAIGQSVTITGQEATLSGKMTIGESVMITGDNASVTFSGDFVIGKSVEMWGANATLNGDLIIKHQDGSLGNLFVQKTNDSDTSGASAATPAVITGKVVANELQIKNVRYGYESGKGITQLNIVDGADVTVNVLYVGYKSIGSAAQLNLKGGTLTVTPTITDSDVKPVNALYIGHWNGLKGTLTVEGGILNAESAIVAVGLSGNNVGTELNINTFSITSGEASVSGVDLGTTVTTANGAGTSILNVSGGTLKIGETGIIQTVVENDATRVVNINLGAGIVGARASWSSSLAMKLGYMASEEASGNTMTTLNTAMGDAVEGYTVTLGGVLSDYSEAQTGGLVKTGKGVLVLSAANTYRGDTVLEEGSLYLGHDSSLGINNEAELTLLAGTTLAADSGAIAFSQVVSMGSLGEGGMETPEGEVIYLGTATKKGKLTMNGAVTLQRFVNTLEVNADTTFAGVVESLSGKLIKEGIGTLTFSNSGTVINELEIKNGTVDFDSAESLTGVKQINVTASGKLDLSNSATAANIHFTGAGTLAGASSFTGILQLGESDGTAVWTVSAERDTQAGSLLLSNQNVRMNVNGALSAKSITFVLGFNNASPKGNDNTVITASNVEITGAEKGSFVLNFDPLYISRFLDQGGGAFQLFSSGVSYGYDVIANNHRQEISLDEQLLKDTGRLVWTRVKLDASLIDQGAANSINQNKSYTPPNGFIYLGAIDGQTVSISSDVEYILNAEEEIFTYKLTPGKGNLIYKGLLTGTGHKLDIIDHASITEKAEDHSEGYVALSNNANDFGLHTNITGVTVIVDLSLDNGQNLTGIDGNLDVNVLGTGDVTLVSSTVSQKGSTLCLRSYGDEKREGINTYTYANDFVISEGSRLLQSGDNDQILTGALLSRAGDNIIANDSLNNFILRGKITHEGNGSLTLHNEQAGGSIVLDGSAGSKDNPALLEADNLNISGAGTVHVLNGYNVQARELTLISGTLSLDENGSLTIGQLGMKGAGTLFLNGGALKSASSWQSEASIRLGIASNTISSGGANVHLNKGVTGEGGFAKEGSGNLFLYNHAEGNAKGVFTVKQGRLILLDKAQEKGRSSAEIPSSEYKLNGDLVLESGKGASLEGMIDANNHNVTFGEKTNFYLSVSESSGLTGYIRNAGTITIGTGTRLHVDVLDDSWITGKNYTIFSANDSILGANNLELALESEYQFVDVNLTYTNDKEVGLILGKKGNEQGGHVSDGSNKGEINAVVAPMVSDVLNSTSSLSGKLLKTMQTVSKMTTTEYQTYLGDMGSSASSFYTALSAQVQDATLHLNSVRNRVELLNPVMYDDWQDGGIYNMWAGGINHYRDVKSGAESPGYKMTSWGGELGVAVPMSEHFLMGIGFSYTSTEVNVKDNWGENENDTYNVDIFARYRKEQWTLTAVLTGGFSNVDFHRNQLVKDELTRSNSSSDGNQFMGTFEAMYDVYLNEEKSWILQPLVNLTAGRAKLDGLSETGELKNAGLMIGSQSYNMFSAGVGAKIAYEYKTEVSDLPGRVELKAMYVNDMGDVDFKVNGRFIGAPENSFNLNGVSNERSAVIVSAGWVAPISTYGQFFADAACEFRKDQNGVSSTVGFSFQF